MSVITSITFSRDVTYLQYTISNYSHLAWYLAQFVQTITFYIKSKCNRSLNTVGTPLCHQQLHNCQLVKILKLEHSKCKLF